MKAILKFLRSLYHKGDSDLSPVDQLRIRSIDGARERIPPKKNKYMGRTNIKSLGALSLIVNTCHNRMNKNEDYVCLEIEGNSVYVGGQIKEYVFLNKEQALQLSKVLIEAFNDK